MAESHSFSLAEIKLIGAANAGQIADYRSPDQTGDELGTGEHWGGERIHGQEPEAALMRPPVQSDSQCRTFS